MNEPTTTYSDIYSIFFILYPECSPSIINKFTKTNFKQKIIILLINFSTETKMKERMQQVKIFKLCNSYTTENKNSHF